MAHDVFISHSGRDLTTAFAVCSMLESEGIRCWSATRHPVLWGVGITTDIEKAIERARIMVLIFNANANASPQIRREVEWAVHNGVIILVFRVEEILPGESLENFLGNVQWLDAVTPPLEKHIEHLAATVKALLPPMSFLGRLRQQFSRGRRRARQESQLAIAALTRPEPRAAVPREVSVSTSRMRLIADWKLEHKGEPRSIELYQGDLSRLPPEHAVDLLVVSAFIDSYFPLPGTVLGALNGIGISVEDLANAKHLDMRKDFSCWISRPVPGPVNFRRILCIESGWRGTPPEIADDVFRALAPSSIAEIPGGSIAMPLIGAGNQGYPADEIMTAILSAAVSWIRRGLRLRTIKIVVNSDGEVALAREAFLKAKQQDAGEKSKEPTRGAASLEPYDLFVSYAHEDSEAALSICDMVARGVPHARIFLDRRELEHGGSWLLQVADSLDAARFVAALYTPGYWTSKYCKDEFAAAFIRQDDTARKILVPIYYRDTRVPYLFQTLQFIDCRESDSARLAEACRSLCALIG